MLEKAISGRKVKTKKRWSKCRAKERWSYILKGVFAIFQLILYNF